MPQPPRNDGWKHKGAGKPANKPAAQHVPNTSRKQWQPGAPKPKTTGKKTSRAARFVIAGVVVGLLSAAVVFLILFLRESEYPNFVIVAPDFPDTLTSPENAAGVKSAKEIQEWPTGEKTFRGDLSAGREATAAGDDEDPCEVWAKKEKLDAKNKSTVVYFAVHVGVDATGPYLWMPRAKGLPAKLYVDKVIQRLAKLEKPALLVIDIAQTPPNWAFGGAYGDFPQAVKGMNTQIDAAGKVAVLLSADAGQTSWTAEERRKTAFGHFFLEGLRGAGQKPGHVLTAADLAKYLRGDVQKWAKANRAANQEPLLLPSGPAGEAKAAAIKLTTLPAAGYTPPPPPPAAPGTPDLLKEEWKRVDRLTDPKRSTQPDTTNPILWREYLEWLLRWERLVRLDDAPPGLPRKVQALGEQLEHSSGTASSEVVALPAGPALFGGKTDFDEQAFDALWKPRTTVAQEWKELPAALKAKPGVSVSTTAIQVAVARYVVNRVLQDGFTRTSLDTAEQVLAEVGKDGVLPIEAHYLRMLQRHLPADTTAWPKGDRLPRAVKLRRTAEETAWAAGKSYPEQAFRWTSGLIAKADRERQLGEDLLFSVDPKSHAEADKRFDAAEKGYAAAQDRAAVVVAALTARDRVFARLPYYARWVASPRGGPATAKDLVLNLKQAAAAAHQIDLLLQEDPAGGVGGLDAQTKLAAAFEDVVRAFEKASSDLAEQKQGSNWHELEAVLNVPFRKLNPGVDLSAFARNAAFELGSKPPSESDKRAEDADLRTAADRHLQVADAYLPGYALAGSAALESRSDALVTALRDLPGKAKTARDAADNAGKLIDAGGDYATANRHARLSDPACPTDGAPNSPEADRRFRRHYFLLDQAGRITLDGWCGTRSDEERVAEWYCSQAAKKVTADAAAELKFLVPGRDELAPDKKARLDADLSKSQALTPTKLKDPTEDRRVVLPDEFRLRHTVNLTATGGPVGYPVCEYALPDAMATSKANKEAAARQVENGLVGKTNASVEREKTFEPGVAKFDKDSKLTGVVIYRGRVYEHAVTLDTAKEYTLQVVNTPATGKAVMAMVANPDAVAGAVTILLDKTNSMDTDIIEGVKKSRWSEAIDGLEKLLAKMPKGTQVQIVLFSGPKREGQTTREVKLEPMYPQPFKVDGTLKQRQTVAKEVGNKPLANGQAITPVAGAIEQALDPKRGTALWPDPEKYTGERTLIVLTDGEDNWNDKDFVESSGGYDKGKKTPLDVVRASVLGAVKDEAAYLNVHLVLFGMKQTEAQIAAKQFESLTDDKDLRDRGRFYLLKGVNDADQFADELGKSVMPQMRYRAEGGKGGTRVMKTTRDGDGYNATPLLDPGTYLLLDPLVNNPRPPLGAPLLAGERLVLRAELRGDKGVVTRPPVAFELAKQKQQRYAAGGQVALTLPRLKYEPGTNDSTIDAVVTFEATNREADQVGHTTADGAFVWIEPELTKKDGTPYAPNEWPQTTIRTHLEADPVGNTCHLLAPASDVTLKGWDGPGGNTFRRPPITGYWASKWPVTDSRVQPVLDTDTGTGSGDLYNLKPFDKFQVAGGTVKVYDAVVKKEKGGWYLRVWMDFPQAGDGEKLTDKLVYLRARWKQAQLFVAEKHTYYYPHRRYTAEFGPFGDTELRQLPQLELYALDDLKKATEQDWRVTLGASVVPTAQPDWLDKLRLSPKPQ